MHKITRLPLALIALGSLAACGTITEPQTYFSSVFTEAETAYQLTTNNEGHVLGNALVDVTLSRDGVETSYEFAFYEGGMTRTRQGATSINGATVNATLITTYDYGSAGGVFTETTVEGQATSKVFTAWSPTTLSRYVDVIEEIESTLTDSVRAVITSQATNLVIGGQSTALDWKTYTLPVNTFIDSYAPFEPLVGFIPTSVDVVIRYQSNTKALEIDLEAENSTSTFVANALLSNPGTVNAADYVLSSTEKATFSGYQA